MPTPQSKTWKVKIIADLNGSKTNNSSNNFKDTGKALWKDLETLFGDNGACGGCWCMFWRQEKGEKWDQTKGPIAKARFKKLIESGKTFGAIAYDQKKPIGWCAFDKRTQFVKLNRAPSFACEDSESVWSIPCFFITREYRQKGVGKALLDAVLTELKRRNAKIVEAYPVRTQPQKIIPAAFAWTGTDLLFKKLGFLPVEYPKKYKVRRRTGTSGKVRMRLNFS